MVKVGLTQMHCDADPASNHARQVDLITQAAARGAQIVCTQELYATQYFCQSEDYRFFDFAQTIPGPSTEAFCKLAREKQIVIVASLFEKRTAGLHHNTAAIIDADGTLLGIYRKMHIPDDPQFYEKFYFTPGDLGFMAWKTRYAKIGVLICWDQWFPEAARLTALRGAQILFYPTAIAWHPEEPAEVQAAQHDAWELIQRSHAVTNGCYVAVANRIGHENILGPDGDPVSPHGLNFWGQSFVAAPDGRLLHRASANQEELIIIDCDLNELDYARTHWPFLRDRRIDAYDELNRRFIDKP